MTPAQMIAYAAVTGVPWMLVCAALVGANYLLLLRALNRLGDRVTLAKAPPAPKAAPLPQPARPMTEAGTPSYGEAS